MEKKVSENTRGFSEERDEKDSNERRIKVDTSKYSPVIQQPNDSQLVEISDIVTVKQSFTLTTSENNNFIKRHMDDMKQQLTTDMTQIQNELKTKVSTNMSSLKEETTTELKTEVINKVIDEVFHNLKESLHQKIDDSTATIRASLEDYRKEVNQDAPQMQNPATGGPSEEDMVLSKLKKEFPTFEFTSVSKPPGKGDILVETPDDHQFRIKVKSCTSDINKDDRDTFVQNVESSVNVKVGLMFSLKSRIAKKCKKGSFQLEAHNGKFLIYVPKASQQVDIMVWSVLLANELAGMNCNLKEGKAKQLQRLCEKFEEQAESAKKCREKIEIMKKAVDDLDSEMKPVLERIEKAGKEINDIMKQ